MLSAQFLILSNTTVFSVFDLCATVNLLSIFQWVAGVKKDFRFSVCGSAITWKS